MPEGDTIWRVSNDLHKALVGNTLNLVELRVPELSTLTFPGAVVTDVQPYGKHILMHLTDGQDWTLRSHLRMDGEWKIYRGTAPFTSADIVRAVIATNTHTAVGYRLGMLDVVPRSQEASLIGHLGPYPLDTTYDHDLVVARMLEQPDRQVGDFLLDQRMVSGFGTHLITEACSVTGVAPHAAIGSVDATHVLTTGERMMTFNRSRPQRVTTGRLKHDESSWAFGRKRCLRCNTALSSVTIGNEPYQRTVKWCPICQPLTEPGVSEIGQNWE